MTHLKKTEVRIGNYFLYVDSFDCRENDDINQISESDFEDNTELWERKLPIHLTEEWFLKLGFSKNPEYSVFGLINEFGRFSIWLDGQFKIGTETINKKIRFVHELQNLYFALTGQELQFYNS